MTNFDSVASGFERLQSLLRVGTPGEVEVRKDETVRVDVSRKAIESVDIIGNQVVSLRILTEVLCILDELEFDSSHEVFNSKLLASAF
jgi:hypothetical protein